MANSARIKSRAVLLVVLRMLRAYLYYPLLIGSAIWIYIKDAHFIWAIALLIGVWFFDPVVHLIRYRLRRIKKQ